jgi:hypothetical protein
VLRPLRPTRSAGATARHTLRWAIVALAAVLSVITASLQASPAHAAAVAMAAARSGDHAQRDTGSGEHDELCGALRGLGCSRARVEPGSAGRFPDGLFRSLPVAVRFTQAGAGAAFSTIVAIATAPRRALSPGRARSRLMVFLN